MCAVLLQEHSQIMKRGTGFVAVIAYQENAMKHYILLRKSAGGPVAVDYEQLSGLLKVFVGADGPRWIIRYAYYAFVFSLPFEAVDIGLDRSVVSLSKVVGYTFIMV